MADKIFFSPAEHKLQVALQLLAVLVERLGGEVLIERREFEMFEGVSVVGRDYSTHMIMRLGDEDEEQIVELPDNPNV